MRYEESLQLCTRPQYREILEKVLQPVRKQTLTQAALETLAVVAYRQPSRAWRSSRSAACSATAPWPRSSTGG